MATGDVYRHGYDEDVPQPTTATCPACDGHVTTTTRETVCDDCGFVMEASRIDHGAEWRAADERAYDDDVDEDDPARTGPPLTPTGHHRGLSTTIGYQRTRRGPRWPGRHDGSLIASGTSSGGRSWRGHARAPLTDHCCAVRRLTAAAGEGMSLRWQACQRVERTADSERARSPVSPVSPDPLPVVDEPFLR